MAHHVEPMDIDNIEGDFDNKENTFHLSNVLSKTPCTEKGYEELDVSELNMKLRYSITPASSPMSKSYTAQCLDRNSECPENTSNLIENANLTRSFNSTLTKNDSLSKSLKIQPLQLHSVDTSLDNNRNTSVLRPLDTTVTEDANNITVTVTHDIEENLSLPSSSSSVLHTPEATTPTKDIPKSDGGSPIMRGLKSVLNMFRASQSPIPTADCEDNIVAHDISSPVDLPSLNKSSDMSQVALASTPITAHKQRETSSKRGSPLKESIVFNEDLEKELLWKDETTILFSEEKIPIHKLFFQQSKNIPYQSKESEKVVTATVTENSLNDTVEFMDVSYNDSIVSNKTICEVSGVAPNTNIAESDSEFVDCETTFTQPDDEEVEEHDKETNVTPIIDVCGHSQTATELETTTNNFDKNLLPTNILNEIPKVINNDLQHRLHSQVSSVKTGVGQDIEPIENTGNLDETQNLTTSLNPLMNITEEIDTQTLKDNRIPLDATVNIEKEDDSIADKQINTCIEDVKPLDATVSIESDNNPIVNTTQVIALSPTDGKNNTTLEVEDKPVSASTFIMNSTQNIDTSMTIQEKRQNIDEHINSTVSLTSDTEVSMPTDITNNNGFIQGESNSNNSNNPLDATVSVLSDVVSSITFTRNSTKNVDTYLYDKINEVDTTATINPQDLPTSSTFTKDITQDIEFHISEENIVTAQDTTVLLDLEKKPVLSSTFINDINQSEKEFVDSTTGSIQIPTSIVNKDMIQDLKHHVPSGDNSTGPPQQVEQLASTSFTKDIEIPKSLDSILSDNEHGKSSIGHNDLIQQIIESQFDATGQKTNTDKDFEIDTNSVIETPFGNDIVNPLDATLSVTAPEGEKIVLLLESDAQNCQMECENTCIANNVQSVEEFSVDHKKRQIESNEPTSSQFDNNEIQCFNPGLLNDSGDAGKCLMDIIEVKVLDSDNIVNNVMEPIEDIGSGEKLPENIPLPDEDDNEMEQLSAVQISLINNIANKHILPDVINDLDSSKIQEVNVVDEVQINTIIDQLKPPADLVTNKLHANMEEMDNNKNMNSNGNVLNNNEKLLLKQNLMDSVSQTKENETLKSEMLESKPEDQLQSMDISNNTHNISLQDNSTLHDEIQSLNPNITNKYREKADIKTSSDVIDQPTNDPMTNRNVSMSNIMETDMLAEKNEAESITDTLQYVPKVDTDVDKKEIIHEEIIVSENNSPYVLVSVDKDADNEINNSIEEDFEKIENPFANKSKIKQSPPTSPPIASKGYNFNFDEIDDPFATKTKIRTSPSLDSPTQFNKSVEKKQCTKGEIVPKNKRKSYPIKPKPVSTKKTSNVTFDGSKSTEKSELVKKDCKNQEQSKNTTEIAKVLHDNIKSTELNVVDKSELENNTDNVSKAIVSINTKNKEVASHEKELIISSSTPSSSDQSIYLSAGTSSSESITQKNVFNLPEIDDMNFNPFATKSQIRFSPPPSLECEDTIITDTKSDSQNIIEPLQDNNQSSDTNLHKLHNISQQNRSGYDEKDSSNASNTTRSSKDDKNATVREIHTDDDDTIEGPFLEAEEDNEIAVLDSVNDMKNNELAGLDIKNDMMEFSDLPTQDNEDNEMFIDAASYEFLLNQNKSNVVVDSGKESLFLKFDPLFAKRLSSDGIAAALSKLQKRQSTPKKQSKAPQISDTEQSIAGPSTSTISSEQLSAPENSIEDLNITTTKPMMVVTPAVNPIVMPRKSTPTSSTNRRSITFTSPAIAVIDRLLSLSANNSLVDQNTTITQVTTETNEAEQALTQLRELLAEKEINVYTLRSESKELKERLTILETQMKLLETESEQRLKKVNDLNEKLTEKTQINKSMAAVVEEYERTIASLIAETEQDRKQHDEERARLIKERDEQTAHLASMEVSFSDLHSKYEKSKQIILSCKANEDTYKKSIKDFEENLTKMQSNYELLKQHATSKLNHANQELEKMNRAHESEVLKLNAMIKRKELHITSLEETLAQKTKANEELTAICDELINKVG